MQVAMKMEGGREPESGDRLGFVERQGHERREPWRWLGVAGLSD